MPPDLPTGPPDASEDALLRLALAEDIGSGDLSAEWFLPELSRSRARLTAREAGVLSGIGLAARVFHEIDPQIHLRLLASEGQTVRPGQTVLELEGSTRSLLTAERTALNFLQHLSGIATLTARFVAELAGTPARLLDTRKTLPGWRSLEKAAVRAGGGNNHRMGLYDRVMLKDNHLAAFPDWATLRQRIREFRALHPGIKIEMEADTVEQAAEFLTWPGVDIVLLDNMSLDELRRCVECRRAPVELEASGGIKLSNLRAVALTGVDWISVGAITHSAPALDFGLDFESLPPSPTAPQGLGPLP